MSYRVLAIAGFSALGLLIHQPHGRSLSITQSPIGSASPESRILTISRTSDSLPNNTSITEPQGTSGNGVLKVKNGTARDAAIKLVDRASGTTLRFVYVRANQTAEISGIGPYSCTLKYTTGQNWNPTTRKFSQNQTFYKFKETLNFIGERQRVTYTATLNPVNNGNTIPRRIAEREF